MLSASRVLLRSTSASLSPSRFMSTIKKPVVDHRTYEHRIVQLPHAVDASTPLRCLFVQDGKTEKAAACMAVHVGAAYDPPHLPGLAHFCEHMLFLGSERHPGDATYKQFLNQHGGRCNASTAAEVTNYFFDVAADHLEGALDIFSAFFICPLMQQECVEREINAVHSENAKNETNDGRRINQLRKGSAAACHPFSNFSTGNKLTLTPPGGFEQLHDELLGFHEEFYRAGNMDLVIIGREEPDVLESWVKKCFTGIRGGGGNCRQLRDLERFSDLPPAFGPEQLGQEVRIVPVKNLRQLRVDFPLPSMRPCYRQKPDSYWSHLLGHEGSGSVCAALKEKGWILSLSAGCSLSTSDAALFTVSMTMTEDGFAHRDEVLATIFRYIDMVKDADYPSAPFLELKRLRELQFLFMDTMKPMPAAKYLAGNLKWYSPSEVISGPFLAEEWDKELVVKVGDCLVPSRALIFEISKDFEGETTEEEQWYGTHHTRSKIQPQRLELWQGPACHPLSLPEANKFVPTGDLTSKGEKAAEPSHPSVLTGDDEGKWKVYHKLDDTFLQPKANVIVNLLTPAAYETPKAVLLTQLYCWILSELLAESTYEASIAQARFQVHDIQTGVQLNFYGFDEKLHVLIGQVLAQDLSFDEVLFANLKEKLSRQYRNMKKAQAHQVATVTYRHMLLQPHWSIEERLAHIEDLTSADLREHMSGLFRTFRGEILMHAFPGVALPQEQRPMQRVMEVPAGTEYRVELEHEDDGNDNGATILFWQLGEVSEHKDEVCRVFGRLVKQPAFTELRTKQQLGYIVWSEERTLEDTKGFKMTVQSAKPPHVVHDRMLAFLRGFEEELEAMDEEAYEDVINGLVQTLMEPCMRLSEETGRHWHEIERRTLRFGRHAAAAKEIRTVTKAEVQALLRSILSPDEARLLSVWLYPCGTLNDARDHEAGAGATNNLVRLTSTVAAEELRTSLTAVPTSRSSA